MIGLWEMIVIIAVAGIVAEVVKSVYKSREKGSVNKSELSELHTAITKMQADIDEIRADLSTIVIQMDDLKLK